MQYNNFGNLENNCSLTDELFIECFCYNVQRVKLFNNFLQVTKELKKIGCAEVYIVGSFVTTKSIPNDIDICVDITKIDESKLANIKIDISSDYGLQKIKKNKKVHLILFDSYNTEILDWFRFDRDKNLRGIVKLDLRNFKTL